MATLTVYSDLVDGHIQSYSSSYATARSGDNLSADNSSINIVLGQVLSGGLYWIYEGFISFDTSAIGAGTVTSATLSLCPYQDQSVTDYTLYARAKDWGASLTTADWVAGASLSGLTLLASVSTVGISVGSYTALSSESAFTSNINTSGSTRIILTSSRHEGNSPPTGLEYVAWYSAEASAGYRPKLVVEYTAGISSHPYYYNLTYM